METFQFDWLGYLRNMAFLIILLGVMSYVLVKLKTRGTGQNGPAVKLPFLNFTESKGFENTSIEVIERKSLEARKQIYLVRIFDDQYWLIGTTDTQIEALGQIQPPKRQAEAKPPFSDYLEDHEIQQLD